jgi:hypothetical protein
MLGRADETAFLRQGLSPKTEVGYVTNPDPSGGHTLLISINGYRASIGGTAPRDQEYLSFTLVTTPEPLPRVKKFNELSPNFDRTSNDEAVRILWNTGAKPGTRGGISMTHAAFLLPRSDALGFLGMVQRDPNALHSLLVSLFPAYQWLYPNLNLGNMEVSVQEKRDPPQKPGTSNSGRVIKLRYAPASAVRPVNLIV